MIVLVCGFMGAGKTTLLAKFAKFNPVDLDQLILESYPHYHNLVDLIEDKGFKGFRLIESLTLTALLEENCKDPLIVALGGGAFNEETIPQIRAILEVKVVWLKTPFSECLKRIKQQISVRPLSKLSNEELYKLYLEREKWYKQADFTGETQEQAIEIITNLVNSRS